MDKVLLIGGLAVGGYLLYKWSQEQSLLTATAVSNATTVTPVANKYAPYYVSPSLEAQLQNFYRTRWNTTANPTFDGWSSVYLQMTGNSMPFYAQTFGIPANNAYSVDQWATVINQAVANGGALPQLAGLGMLALANSQHPSLQNKRLPYSLELFNAMVR